MTKIHLIKVNTIIDQYIPGDDIKSIDVLNLSNMKQLVKAYQDLPETLWYKGIEGEFRWIDYGQIYAIVHQKALEII